MASINYVRETLTDAGATYTIDVESGIDALLIKPDTNPLTMLGNIVVNFSGTPFDGQMIRVGWGTGIDLNGNTMTVNGLSVTAEQALAGDCYFEFTYVNVAWSDVFVTDMAALDTVSGNILLDGSVALSKLEDGTPAQIIVVNSSNRPVYVTETGDVTRNSSGVTAIGAGVVVNADINASAAIARSKLGTGTANHVVINDGIGAFSSEAQLSKQRGGFGQDVSAATGIAKFDGGTLSISSSVESRDYQVSFETGYVGADNTYTLGFDCTLTPTDCSAFVIKAIAATDDAVITLLKNGVAISSGTITFAASSAQDAAGVFGAFSATNFTAGDTISLRSSKPTAGGVVNVTLQFTRNT